MKFYYFDVRGRGEISRLIMAATGKDFGEKRVQSSEWPNLKPKAPIGQMPFMVVNESTTLAQSLAIARYLARENGLAGNSNLDAAKIDAVVDTALDGNNDYVDIVYHFSDARKSEAEKTFNNETLPALLTKLEKLKKMYGSENHMVGDKLSWADLYVFDSLQNFEELNKSEVDKHVELLKVKEEVLQNKNVAQYLLKRKKQ